MDILTGMLLESVAKTAYHELVLLGQTGAIKTIWISTACNAIGGKATATKSIQWI